jgi:hypothetical protein
MPETFHQAFLHHLRPQVLKDIVIGLIAFFPMSFLDNYRNVRVTLDCCDETLYDKKSTNPESYPVPFEHLSLIYYSEPFLANIAPWVQMHGLRSLSLEYTLEESSSSPQQLLVACSTSLTKLSLETRVCTSSAALLFYLKADFLTDYTSYNISNDFTIHNGDIAHFPFKLTGLRNLTQLIIDTRSHLYGTGESWTLRSPIPAIAELVSTARPTLKEITVKIVFIILSGLNCEQLPDPGAVWFPFIPLAVKCSSATISMYISPSFVMPDSLTQFAPCLLSALDDYKGLTPYVQRGVVVISDWCFHL